MCCGFHYETYIGISPYRILPLDWAQCMADPSLVYVWLDRVRKYKRCSFFVRYVILQHMFNEWGVRLKAHTLFIERVLYLPISHSNEHRLHILYHIRQDNPELVQWWIIPFPLPVFYSKYAIWCRHEGTELTLAARGLTLVVRIWRLTLDVRFPYCKNKNIYNARRPTT